MALIEKTELITPEGKKAQTKRDVIKLATSGLQTMESVHKQLFGLFWKNRYGLKPQEVFDIWNETKEASKWFEFAKASEDFIFKIDAEVGSGLPHVVATGHSYKINEDGTVIVDPPALEVAPA